MWGCDMDVSIQDEQAFFAGHEVAWPLFERFQGMFLDAYPETRVKVQKTQISYYNRHMYACVSFLRVRRKAELPASYFVLTLGMPERLDTPRAVVTEPYPGRWTTHVVLCRPDELDEELSGWIAQAYHFAQVK